VANPAMPKAPAPKRLGAVALSTIVAVALALSTVLAVAAGSLAGPRAFAPDLPAELLAAPSGDVAPLISPGAPPGGITPP